MGVGVWCWGCGVQVRSQDPTCSGRQGSLGSQRFGFEVKLGFRKSFEKEAWQETYLRIVRNNVLVDASLLQKLAGAARTGLVAARERIC